VALLVLLEKWFEMSVTCVRWHRHDSLFFTLIAGVRQGGVLSAFLFAILLTMLSTKSSLSILVAMCPTCDVCTGIFLYADDILLLAPSVNSLKKLLSACEEELYFVTMCVNDKKSVYIRFGNRHDVCCAPVTTCSGGALRWVDTCRYLGIYFVSARSFKCTFEPARTKFYKSFNAIFGKVGRVASESVIMELQ